MDYLRNLSTAKLVLWCYLIWYLVTLAHHFEASATLWINSLGISGIIGVALLLSVNSTGADKWQTFRLFLMPFCVSSFSASIKDEGFTLIFSPDPEELVMAVTACLAFVVTVLMIQRLPQKVR